MTDVPSRVPVLVVGGGPSGLAAAIELGRRGIEVLVVEPRTELDPLRPRAKTTSARTMEHLRRWGIADRLRAAAPLPVSHAQDVVFCTGLFGHEITRFRNAFALFPERVEELAGALDAERLEGVHHRGDLGLEAPPSPAPAPCRPRRRWRRR